MVALEYHFWGEMPTIYNSRNLMVALETPDEFVVTNLQQ